MNVFKYHVSSTGGKILVRINIEITLFSGFNIIPFNWFM